MLETIQQPIIADELAANDEQVVQENEKLKKRIEVLEREKSELKQAAKAEPRKPFNFLAGLNVYIRKGYEDDN